MQLASMVNVLQGKIFPSCAAPSGRPLLKIDWGSYISCNSVLVMYIFSKANEKHKDIFCIKISRKTGRRRSTNRPNISLTIVPNIDSCYRVKLSCQGCLIFDKNLSERIQLSDEGLTVTNGSGGQFTASYQLCL